MSPYLEHSEGDDGGSGLSPRAVFVILGLIAAACIVGALFGCSRASAQADVPATPSEARSAEATSVLNLDVHPDDCGQVAGGSGLGGEPPASEPQQVRSGSAAPEANCAPGTTTPAGSLDLFAAPWLTAEYQFDSREDQRVLSFEGHSRPGKYVDLYGSLDLYSSLDTDAARFSLRSGVFGRVAHAGGLAVWLEDFNGSSNSTMRFGFYRDVLAGGDEPFVRAMLLPVSTEGRGPMARGMFHVELAPRWSLAGFAEVAWDDEVGTWVAAEPELRYALRDGLWATLEYRRDERWEDVEGLALGLRAGL